MQCHMALWPFQAYYFPPIVHFWVLNPRGGWVGGVRCLGQSLKKTFFMDSSPNQFSLHVGFLEASVESSRNQFTKSLRFHLQNVHLKILSKTNLFRYCKIHLWLLSHTDFSVVYNIKYFLSEFIKLVCDYYNTWISLYCITSNIF